MLQSVIQGRRCDHPPPPRSDREFLDNFCTVFVSFVISRLNCKMLPCLLPLKTAAKCTQTYHFRDNKWLFCGGAEHSHSLDANGASPPPYWNLKLATVDKATGARMSCTACLKVYLIWLVHNHENVVFLQINDEIICHYGKDPDPAKSAEVTGLSDKLLEIMIQHHGRIPSLKWQYFGNEHGTLYTYPAVATCGKDYETYDPRIRRVVLWISTFIYTVTAKK